MKFKIVYLALALVLVFSMAAALGTGIAQANGTTPAVMSGGQHTVELEEDGIAVDNAGDNLLQFTSHGHVLGFSNDGVIVGSRDHMLRIDFVNSRTVDPEAGEDSPIETGKGMAAPLSRVTYHNIWDDVTVVYEASEGAIVKSTYYVNATEDGVPVEHIRLGYNRPVSLDENGNLVIAYETGTIVETAPVAWQEVKGERKPVIAAYTLYGDQEVGFSLGDYMPGIPVVIDPELTWNTFLGGSGYDNGYGIAVDASGNVYVAGSSGATWGSPVRAFTSVTSDSDAFVAKLDSSGSLTWHTFLGGSGYDRVYGIAVDASGNVYVAGSSGATWGSPVRAHTGANDAFAARLTSSGSLTWHTFLGGSGNDNGYGIAVDGSGNVYVSGDSNAIWGSPERAYTSGDDAFAARLTSSGSLIWNTFLGGSGGDRGWGIAVDGSGNVVRSKLDGELLRNIALVTNGAFVPAGVATLDLDSIIKAHLTPMVRSSTEAAVRVVPAEQYPWFVLGTLLSLLLALWVGSVTMRRTA